MTCSVYRFVPYLGHLRMKDERNSYCVNPSQYFVLPSTVISHRIKPHNRCFNTSDKIGYSALVFNNIINLYKWSFWYRMKILSQKYCLALHCEASLMLVWLYLFLLHNYHPPIYLTFCTVLHIATCNSAKGESRIII